MLVTFPVLNSHMWIVATLLEGKDIGHFNHCRKLSWATVLQRMYILLLEDS